MATALKHKKILQNRRKGLYNTDETRDELQVAVKQLFEEPTDEYITLVQHLGVFNVFSQKEFLAQLKLWKQKKCVLLDCNIHEREIAGRKITFFVVQPPDDKDMPSVCPLAMAMGFLVSGFTYICKNKSSVDLVKRYLETA